MATEADLIKDVLRRVGESTNSYSEKLTAAYAAGGAALTVASDATTRIDEGDYLEFLDDNTYDIFYVSAAAATSLTADGGMFGSTNVNHANGARFRKPGRWFAITAQEAINDAIAGDLYPDLFAVYETTYSPSTTWSAESTLTKEIAATAEDVLRAYQKTDTTPTRLLEVRVSQPFYVDNVLAPTHQKAIRFEEIPDDNNTIFVQYVRKPAMADLSDAMQRIVEYGAIWRMLEWEAAGATARPRPQSGHVAPGQEMRDARSYRAEQRELIAQEKQVLNRRYPRRRRVWHGRRYGP